MDVLGVRIHVLMLSENGHLQVLQWGLENGAPTSQEARKRYEVMLKKK